MRDVRGELLQQRSGPPVRLAERHPCRAPAPRRGRWRRALRPTAAARIAGGIEPHGVDGSHQRRAAPARACPRRRTPAPCPPGGRGGSRAADPAAPTSAPTNPPAIRAAFARASSAVSGFRFCGMMLDPVVYASSSSAHPSAGSVHRARSAASRERWVAQIAGVGQELLHEVAVGHGVDRVVERAPEPESRRRCGGIEPEGRRGERGRRPAATRTSAPPHWSKRSRSRSNAHACARR